MVVYLELGFEFIDISFLFISMFVSYNGYYVNYLNTSIIYNMLNL